MFAGAEFVAFANRQGYVGGGTMVEVQCRNWTHGETCQGRES